MSEIELKPSALKSKLAGKACISAVFSVAGVKEAFENMVRMVRQKGSIKEYERKRHTYCLHK